MRAAIVVVVLVGAGCSHGPATLDAPVQGDLPVSDGTHCEPRDAVADADSIAVGGGPGWQKPRMVVDGCVQNAVRIPGSAAGWRGRFTVRFTVRANGSPARFSADPPAPDAILCGIWRAVSSCEWAPGTDPAGQPANLWVVMPFRFQ